jgi:hypothetical protein
MRKRARLTTCWMAAVSRAAIWLASAEFTVGSLQLAGKSPSV